MKWRDLMFIFAPFSWTTTEISEINLCKNCQHIQTNQWNETVCSLYGRINVVSGYVIYERCEDVRDNEDKCGLKGRFYQRRIPFFPSQPSAGNIPHRNNTEE